MHPFRPLQCPCYVRAIDGEGNGRPTVGHPADISRRCHCVWQNGDRGGRVTASRSLQIETGKAEVKA